MSRTLRPRKSRPSYVALAGLQDEADGDRSPRAGPSIPRKQAHAYDDDADSGSNFEPEKDQDVQKEQEEDAMGESIDDEDEGPESDTQPPKAVRKASPTRKVKVVAKGATKPSLSRASKRQMYVLPTPSVHHRHRAMPLYTRTGRVERLESPPSLFKPPKITMTNNFTQNSQITDRVNKAWGFNVGWGPLWEMVEDRGWYKEAVEGVDGMDNDAYRRPRVYGSLSVKSGWGILDKGDASVYLPSDVIITDEGNLKPPPPVSCFLGPFGKQIQVEMKMFQTHKMADFLPGSKGHIFNAGAPVWGLDWCPIHAHDRAAKSFKQYLAIAPFPTRAHSPEIGRKVARPSYACIQIWSLGPTEPVGHVSDEADRGQVKCEMVLCLDRGPALEVKWCPLPSHDEESSSVRPRKLGLLGGSFEDGSWSLYAVPDPRDITPPDHDPEQPIYVKLPEPILRIELIETSCWTFDWGNSEIVAIGTTNGIIAIYDIGPSLKSIDNPNAPTVTDILPTHYLTVHQSAIRALAWIRAPPSLPSGAPNTQGDPTVLASGGYDGVECMTDIREGHGSVMNRTRDVINAMAFSPFGGGPVTIDHENIVKAYSASPSMLGRGHTLLEPQGPVWSVGASDLHPQLAVGSADGSCITTNSLRSTRRGGSVPFFIHKVYQLDYSRKTGVYRMLERFLPQETQDRPPPKTQPKKKEQDADKGGGGAPPPHIKTASGGTGAWPREVGVQRVAWNSVNGLAAAALLASATAAGLCRVDEVWGRWIRGKVPYGGIEHIRRELEDEMDVDEEDEEGEDDEDDG